MSVYSLIPTNLQFVILFAEQESFVISRSGCETRGPNPAHSGLSVENRSDIQPLSYPLSGRIYGWQDILYPAGYTVGRISNIQPDLRLEGYPISGRIYGTDIYFEIRNRPSCFTFSSFHSSTPNITSLFSCKNFATVIYNNLFYCQTLPRCQNTQVCEILTFDFQYHATKMNFDVITYLVFLDHTTKKYM